MQRNARQRCAQNFLLAVTLSILVSPAHSQETGGKTELQQKVAAVKQSVAQNQQALRQYTWTEKMETIFRTKKRWWTI